MRIQEPSSLNPAVQTSSSYFFDKVGYVFTVMRTLILAIDKIDQVVFFIIEPHQRIGDAETVALKGIRFETGKRNALVIFYDGTYVQHIFEVIDERRFLVFIK